MIFTDFLEFVIILLFGLICFVAGRLIFKCIFAPIIVKKTTHEVEKNPKWITPKLRQKYYGFSNIDIITANSTLGALPRFRLNKNKEGQERLELLIPEDTPVSDIDKVATLALQGKLRVYHNLYFPDKSAYWLSILLYLLDGGDIEQESIIWGSKNK